MAVDLAKRTQGIGDGSGRLSVRRCRRGVELRKFQAESRLIRFHLSWRCIGSEF